MANKKTIIGMAALVGVLAVTAILRLQTQRRKKPPRASFPRPTILIPIVQNARPTAVKS